jgi:Ran GTPase-activating protein (RanGAP) involved in mRNA processing and transport
MHTIATACTSLRSVHLDGTEGFPLHNVTDKAIASLAEHCGHLEELSVRQSGVTTFGIQILSERAPNAHALKWRKLHFKSIDLWGSRVDNTVVEWLSQFEGLENLGVGKCPSFTSEGLSKLFKAMPSPKKIRNIDLSFSRIKAPALTTLSQIFGKTLEKLDLSGNRLSEKTCKDLCQDFYGGVLRSLTLRRCRVSASGVCKFISQCTLSLETLDLGTALVPCGDKILAAAVKCPLLQHLDLSMVSIKPKALQLFAVPSNRLQFLSVTCDEEATSSSQARSDAEWIYAIRHMQNLHKLKIQGSCRLRSKTLIAILNECKSIEALDIGTTLENSREGGEFLQYCLKNAAETNLKLLRMSDSSFGRENPRTGFIEFSATDWNNSLPRRSSECSGISLHWKESQLLKIEIFGSDCV